jgi:hypothetical protein
MIKYGIFEGEVSAARSRGERGCTFRGEVLAAKSCGQEVPLSGESPVIISQTLLKCHCTAIMGRELEDICSLVTILRIELTNEMMN